MRLISCFIQYNDHLTISPSLNGTNFLYFKYCKSIYQIIFFRNFDASICSSFVAWRHQVDRFLIEQFDRAQAPSCTTIDLDFTSRLDSNNHSSFIFFLLQPLVGDVLVYFSSFQKKNFVIKMTYDCCIWTVSEFLREQRKWWHFKINTVIHIHV